MDRRSFGTVRLYAMELGEDPSRTILAKFDLHRIPNSNVQGVLAQDTSDHSWSFINNDGSDDVGDLLAKGRGRSAMHNRKTFNRSFAGAFYPPELFAPARRAVVARRKLNCSAATAFLEEQAPFPDTFPEPF